MRRLFELLRLRFGDHFTAFGGLLLGIVFAAAPLSLFLPIGPEDAGRDGIVVSLGQSNSYMGNRPKAVVRLQSGERLTVGVRRGRDCRIGDTITIYFYRTVWSRWQRSGACRR